MSAWLLLTKTTRQHGGNEGYDDERSSYYSWNNTVPNHDKPKEGDKVAVWDGNQLLGTATIQNIDYGEAEATRLRCPKCGTTKIKERFKKMPKYRCHYEACKNEFEKPNPEIISVITYKSSYGDSWLDLSGQLEASTLRTLSTQPKSQHSIRPLDWSSFLGKISHAAKNKLQFIDTAQNESSGHKAGIVKLRIGQKKFRNNLIRKFGHTCAFSGACHPAALDAAHLYSYAKHGVHEDHGGLLIRKDLHGLFDEGLICISPEKLRLKIAKEIIGIDQYKALHNCKIKVAISQKSKHWIALHYEAHKNR